MENRVVITGMGIYSCIGISLEEVKESLYKGKSGIVTSCEIAGVKFTDYGKVLYDIRSFPYKEEPQNSDLFFLIRDVDSCLVFDPTELLKQQ